MSVLAYRIRRISLLGGSAALALLAVGVNVRAQEQPTQSPPQQSQPAPTAPSPQPQTPAASAPATAPQAQPSAPPPAAQNPPAPTAPAQAGNNETLPEITVTAQKNKPAPRQAARRAPPAASAAARAVPEVSPTERLTQQNNSFDQARSNLFTTAGTTSATLSHDNIQNLPQGANQPVEKVLLQFPGVSQDSAASGDLHIRNDHANAQIRINGIMLPDGVTGFSSILDPSWIGSLSLVAGALPAEFGMRTTGLIDITTRNDIFNNSGSVGVYGGSRSAMQSTFEYGGTFGADCPPGASSGTTSAKPSANCVGAVQYFFTGSYLQNREGIENPLPTLNAIHDFSQQEKGFAYLSTFVDPWTRLTMMMGTSTASYQIPNVPNAPLFAGINTPVMGVSSFDSLGLNERQDEDTQFGVVALQRSVNGFDGQLSYFTRYDNLHFIPDPTGDLLLNGIASDISRQAYTNGIQGDGSYVINAAHTLRAGFTVSGEKTWVDNTSLVQSITAPFPLESITDDNAKVGWLAGIYAQDEWKLTNNLTMNYGARFDQMWQYTDANQLSPRVSFTYKPFENTTFHAGYARYFTPPVQVEAAPANIGLFSGTTGAPSNSLEGPVLPERSHYFDAGVDQKIPLGCSTALQRDCAFLELGLDGYYKLAKDLIDNGQFGQALVLSAFNYLHGVTEGVEASAKYHNGGLDAYLNLAVSQEKATDPISNQYLFDNIATPADLGGQTELQYLQTHWVNTDHNQFVTGSSGISYEFCGRALTPGEQWWNTLCGTRLSGDMIYGSGFRTGDANISSLRPYEQFNVGIARDFWMPDGKPLTLRFDVVNLADEIYMLRSGTGIGVFAPQFGPRRGYYIGISKKI